MYVSETLLHCRLYMYFGSLRQVIGKFGSVVPLSGGVQVFGQYLHFTYYPYQLV